MNSQGVPNSAMENPLKFHVTVVLVLVLITLLLFGFQVHAVPYDHGYTRECLATPLGPQYGGGIVVNPELNQGLTGWTSSSEGAKIENRQSQDGNNYVVVSNRTSPLDSPSQEFNLDKEKLYTFSAWLQVSQGNALISALLETGPNEYKIAGWVDAREGCWSMLKGGLSVDASEPAKINFASNNMEVDIWVDSVSLQPFTQEEWKSHQDSNIEKVRKRRVKIEALDEQGRPASNATLSIKQTRADFPFGCAINRNILKYTGYQTWFTSRFKYTVFENEMKWYSTEYQGSENYTVPDAMLDFAEAHNISVRGHNVFWDDPSFNPSWLLELPSDTLRAAADRRINSVMQRYKGRLFHWDVVNENLHFSFFEDKLGNNASAYFYGEAHKIDQSATLFLNEFHTIENTGDKASLPTKYLEKVSQIRQQGYDGPLGVGLEGHFTHANLPYVRSSIDMLASLGLPIWITELDVESGPNQVVYLEQLLRELHAHPSVRGLLIWGAWNPELKCYRMCLTDENFNNLATGDVVDRMIDELTHKTDQLQGETDANGYFGSSLFHGEYEVEIMHPTGGKSPGLQSFNVVPNENEGRGPLLFKIKAYD